MRYLLVLLLVSVQGCAMYRSLTEETPPPEATLAKLGPAHITEVGEPLAEITLADLAAMYREVIPHTNDADILISVQHRLADIEILSAEARLASSTANQNYFSSAIAAYEDLLRQNPDSPLNDRFLYQLSKAYELNGNSKKSLSVLARLSTDHPGSLYFAEAEFRQAESYFVAGDYARADAAYNRVIESGSHTLYFSKSLYMRGWSRFKQGKYQSAVASFTASLDQQMPENGQLETLSRSDRELVEDSFRVLAVIFSYLGGVDSIVSVYDELGERDYHYLLYQELGDLYLDQERYRDSAETYKAHTLRFPDSTVAQQFQIRVIAAYEVGGFPQQVLEEKQFYVDAFGQGGDNWTRSNGSTRRAIDEKLKVFIPELAQHFHALAQQSVRQKGNSKTTLQHYRQAATYYQMFVESYPNSSAVPRMGFLLAESQFEAGDYQLAIVSYEWVGYQFTDYENAVESAYSAILAHEKLADPGNELDRKQQLSDRIDSELRFANVFPSDSRAAGVLGHAASGLFEQEQFRQALITAKELVTWQPAPPADITIPAWLTLGHSYFELGDFPEAEHAYQGAIALMPRSDERHTNTVELVAASVYRQAEEAVASGHYARAAEQFARVLVVAPAANISLNAQFDAAHNFIKSGDLAEANRLLIDFRGRYPNNALTSSIPGILLGNYEHLGLWSEAASEIDKIGAAESDSEKQRNAQYLAATYYDKAGDSEQAIQRYRRYAHTWEQPFTERMEAMNRLAELYQEDGQGQKQRFWLDKMMVSHDSAGVDQTTRSLYLAAYSASVVAGDAYKSFQNLTLRIPIEKSLKKKSKAMKKAVDAYSKTNKYGIQQFSTLATYRMARIYQQIAVDLLSSERPSNLDLLAKEQYELLLEEQAYPFEEKAIAIYQANARRSWDGIYDQWVKESFSALGELMPARYAKVESSSLHEREVVPEDANYRFEQSNLAIEQGEWGGARDGLHSLVKDYPGLSGPCLNLALVYRHLDDLEKADFWYRQSIDRNSNNLPAYNQYGIFLREQGHFEQAEEMYLEALAIWEPNPETHRNIGILYDLYRGDKRSAVQHFSRYQALLGEDDTVVSGWIVDLERQMASIVKVN